jgi:hypothetical protein
MAKLEKQINAVKKQDDYIDNSAEIACDFIYDDILPQLDQFEFNNDDPNYVSGLATHGLFVELIQRLKQFGYNEKDLKKEIKFYMNCPDIDEPIH